MQPLFIRIASFFNTPESVYRIDTCCDDHEESFTISPGIPISPVIERYFHVSQSSLANASTLNETITLIKNRFPHRTYDFITYHLPVKLTSVLPCREFRCFELVIDPFSKISEHKNIHEMIACYETVMQTYGIWQKENSGYDQTWIRSIPPLPPLSRHTLTERCADILSENARLYSETGFTYRAQQETLALTIESCFRENKHLLCNAPTGIGKSLAYCVNAALLTGSDANTRVVISTFSRRLQDQLRDKDIPLTERLLGTSLSVAYLKGRSNYLCIDRLQAMFNKRGNAPTKDYIFSAVTAGIREIDALQCGQDMKDELRAFSCSPVCAYQEICFYKKALERAAQAQICVINHALLIRELAFGRLKHVTHLVVDEAHHIEELAVNELGGELTRDTFRFCDFAVAPLVREFSRKWRSMFEDLESLDHEAVELFLQDSKTIRTLISEPDVREQFDAAVQIVRRYFLFKEHYYTEPIERHDGRIYKLYPYRIDGWMRQKFWDKFSSVCMLSGTLFVNEGAMLGIVKRTFGVAKDERVLTLSLPSPFDYASNVRFFVPVDFPRYNFQEKHIFMDAVTAFLKEYLIRTETKALILFTAYEDMRHIADLMSDYFTEQGIQLFMNEYDEQAVSSVPFPVIFGTYGMWEGVDISGDLLHSVIMIKSPFSSPNDGFFKAKQQIMDDALFYLYYLNHAVMKFRQGFGRLIRSVEDRGIFILLDNRITTKSYKNFFLRSVSDDLQLSFVPTRDIFNKAESFLFDKTGLFLKDYRTETDTFRFLDYKQLYIARDGERGIKIIYGSAGTGKTVVLIHRLKFLLMNFPHIERVLFLTFNAALARFIENILHLEGIDLTEKTIDVRYFYELCAAIEPKPDTMNDFSAYYRSILQRITEDPTQIVPYDAVFIDEGQDLGLLEYDIVTRFLNPSSADFMCAIDKHQAIYDIDFSRFFTDKPIRYYSVEHSYRTTAAIQTIAARYNRSLFVTDDDMYFNYGSEIDVLENNDPQQLFISISNYIAGKLKEGYTPGDCAVIYPKHALYGSVNIASTIGEVLRSHGVRVTTLTLPKMKKNFTLRDNTVKLTTVHSSKGLEFKVVIFLGADTIPLNDANKRLCYVAVTRAREILCCAYMKPAHCAEFLKTQNRNGPPPSSSILSDSKSDDPKH